MSIWIENGFKSRNDYLLCLADDYGIASDVVFALADVLGEAGDFGELEVEVLRTSFEKLELEEARNER